MKERSLGFNLEPTFRCNLGCEMCPRYSSEDPHLDMSMEVYGLIAEAMGFAHNVDFTGWGEPLLHTHIYEMIRIAKERGCATSMTSNGTAINATNARRLIDAGMDRLTVSIDGLTTDTYDRLRVGASLTKVEANLRELSAQIRKRRSSLELGIAFTIQEANASQIAGTADWAHSVGAEVLHLKHLNVPSRKEDWDRSLLKFRIHGGPASSRPEGSRSSFAGGRSVWARLSRHKDLLTRAEGDIQKALKRGGRLGVRVMMHSEFPLGSNLKARHCLAAPLNAVYFSHEGKVSPCCHFGHHVSRYFNGQFHPPSSLYFGDIRKSSLDEIWHSPAFAAFRRGFEVEDFPDECRTCYLLYGK